MKISRNSLILHPEMLRILCAIVFLLSVHRTVSAQENIRIHTDAYTIEELVRDVLIQSECAEISNVQFTGQPEQIGFFTKGRDAIDVNTGIILSTGNAVEAAGPNASTNTGTEFNSSNVGDIDLFNIAEGVNSINDIRDNAILEFDFVPLNSKLEFKFIFASEEYCDFAGPNTQKNDVFGFFLSGPGISGPHENNAINIAQSPGNGDNITIRNINHNINYQYYIDNTPELQNQWSPEHTANCKLDEPRDGISSLLDRDGAAVDILEYDGFTVVMIASADVTPFQPYHLKIAIADVNDGTWDSAVFLKAGSFKTGQPQATIEAPPMLSCISSTITLDATNSSKGPFSYEWTTVDGNIVSGANLLTPEINQPGTYRLVVSRNNTQCADTAFIQIEFDGVKPNILSVESEPILCTRPEVDIEVDINHETGFKYRLQYPGGSISPEQNNPVLKTTHAGIHKVIVTATNGCEDSYNHEVMIDTFAGRAVFDDVTFTCHDDTLEIQPTFETNEADYIYSWLSNDGVILSDPNELNLLTGSGGDFVLRTTNLDNGCTAEFELTINENLQPAEIDAGPDGKLDCITSGFTPDAVISSPDGNERIDWISPDGHMITPGIDPLHPLFTVDGYYVLEVERVNGCISRDTLFIDKAEDAPVINLVQKDTLACADGTATIQVDIIGQVESIEWLSATNGISEVSADNLTAEVSKTGDYTIKVINESGCISELSINIIRTGIAELDLPKKVMLDCHGLATIEVDDNENLDFNWSCIEDPAISENTHSITVDQPGTYLLLTSDPVSDCEMLDTVIVVEQDSEIRYELEFLDCEFDQGLFYIHDQDKFRVSHIEYAGVSYNPDHTVVIMGMSPITLHYGDDCKQEIEVQHLMHQPLEVELNLPNPIISGTPFNISLLINRSDSEIDSIMWTDDPEGCFNCLTRELTLDETTEIKVIVRDKYGCIASHFELIEPKAIEQVFVPSAFSPNSDGINDVLKIFYNQHVAGVSSVSIFDRWGNTVFHRNSNSENFDESEFYWNGNSVHDEIMPPGVYMYAITLINTYGDSFKQTGSVTLVR